MQNKYARLGSYRNLNFIIDRQSAAAFESFFPQKNKYVPLQFGFILVRQFTIVGHVSFDNSQPISRKLPPAKPSSAKFLKKQHLISPAFFVNASLSYIKFPQTYQVPLKHLP